MFSYVESIFEDIYKKNLSFASQNHSYRAKINIIPHFRGKTDYMHLTQMISSVYLYNLIFVDLLHQQNAKFKTNPVFDANSV